MPQNTPSVTPEEYKLIQQAPADKFNIVISEADKIKAFCNHKDPITKQNRIQQLSDGKVYCPICGATWDPKSITTEELTEVLNILFSAMQNVKMVGDLGVTVVRDYFPIMALLEKFPGIYDIAMKQFDKYLNANTYSNANEAAIFSQFNNLMGYGGGYQQPYMGYMNNPYQQAQPQMVPNQYGYPVAQPGVNPMQAPQQNAYGQTQMMPQQQPAANPYAQPQVAPMQNLYAPQQAQPMAPIAPTPGVPTPTGAMPSPSYAPVNSQQQNAPVVAENPAAGVAKTDQTVTA